MRISDWSSDVCSADLLGDVPVRPGPLALQVAQHRVEEKRFARHCGLETAPFWGVTSLDELAEGVAAVGVPAILKTCRFGYDGKGQVAIGLDSSLNEAWAAIATTDRKSTRLNSSP